jgi:hypothetical protein
VRAASGFLAAAGPLALGDVTIDADMEYGAVTVVALDAEPIAGSRRILVQVMSEAENHGWQATDLGGGQFRIDEVGSAPISVREMSGSVRLDRADAGSLRVTRLDHNGYRGAHVAGASSITLQPDVLYYLVEPF